MDLPRELSTVKAMLEKSKDPHLALYSCSYHSTEFLWCSLNPATQLLMGRRIRSTSPQTLHLIPKWPYLKKFEEQDRQYKRKQKRNYDKRHRVWSLVDIPDDQPVCMGKHRWTMTTRQNCYKD